MITSILPIWSELNLMEQIYWILTIPATIIFIFLLISTIIGSDIDGDIETNIDQDIANGDSIPFQFISVKNIIAFFTMFGWSGLGFLNADLSYFLVIFLSLVCGLLMMLAMASLFYFMSKLTDDGTLKMKNAIGHLGEVYLPIPGSRGGIGKVQLTVQSSLRTLDAITDDPETISTSSVIEVLDVIDEQILLVKKNGK